MYLFHQGYSVPQKIVFQLVVWANSSPILLIWGHFLLVLVNDLVRGWLAWTLTHWASKPINWLARQENLPVLYYLTGLLFNPAYETQLNPDSKWFLLLSNADHINSRFHKYIVIFFLSIFTVYLSPRVKSLTENAHCTKTEIYTEFRKEIKPRIILQDGSATFVEKHSFLNITLTCILITGTVMNL